VRGREEFAVHSRGRGGPWWIRGEGEGGSPGKEVAGNDVTGGGGGDDVIGNNITGNGVTRNSVTGNDVTGNDIIENDVRGNSVTGNDVIRKRRHRNHGECHEFARMGPRSAGYCAGSAAATAAATTAAGRSLSLTTFYFYLPFSCMFPPLCSLLRATACVSNPLTRRDKRQPRRNNLNDFI